MLRPVRGYSAPLSGVRFLSWLVLGISFAGGLLATTGANAASLDRLAARALQAGSDTVASSPSRPPAPATSAPATTPLTTPATAVRTPTAQSTKAYRLHLHGGLFAPIDVNAPSPTLGLRLGRRVTSHLQAGMLVGWTFQRRNLEEPVNGLPGLQPQLILARVDGQLVPAMVFVHVDFNETRFLVPYAGIATGYEWYLLKANDYRTGETASATYANFAWESWGGIGIRLGQDLRVDSELYYNGGSLEREVSDSSGQSWRETVHANGVGARLGLNLLF